ncbi:serine hydrolase domain-containing protein [Streptomyces sp. NPDC047886]|uniref:serine hydrolase domain-containing protein n=1 Tax=Streptomyces sp. NPDC047886 TaxID=3365490 RepID=UPI00372130BF
MSQPPHPGRHRAHDHTPPARPPRPARPARPAGRGRRERRAVALLTSATAVLCGLIAAPATATTTTATATATGGDGHTAGELRERLERLVRTAGGPPGAIAVLQRGGKRHVVRAGVAELGTERQPRPTDHIRLASTAKMFSGAVSLRLVDQGRLRLDATIGEVLPHLPAAWHEVTLRQLLSHTSGLPDFSQSPEFVEFVTSDPRRVVDSRRLLDFVADEPLLFPPGTRYAYSNSDNITVALMAEAATGRRYEDLLRRLVNRPLALRDTSLPAGAALPEPYLHGYDVSSPDRPEDVSEAISASFSWASGGIVSTPADLNRFIRGYAGGRLVSDATRREQLTFVEGAASSPPGPGVNAGGLAIYRYTTRCGVVYGHTGNTPGYTQLAVATEDGKRSMTFSLTAQISERSPELLAQVRTVQEDFVCALLDDR